jgi:PAS domain S-box-containing protein
MMDNYLLFHSLSELFSISVAGCVFAITWSTRIHRPKEGSFFLVVGIGSLFVGGIDLVHTLAYKGMNVIQGYDSNLPTQLWIASRYIQSISFMAASGLLFLQKFRGMVLSTRAPYILLAGYAVITALILFAIFARVFPVCFIEGSGLTPFKRISEYIICVILTAALFLLRQSRGYFDQEMLLTLMAAIVMSILSELAFALYTDVYGPFNSIGHILKVIVFFALYKAIVQIGIQKPYTLLARDLCDSERRYRTIVENCNEALFIQDFKGNITDVNKNACSMLGYSRDELIGANISTISRPNCRQNIAERMKKYGENNLSLFESEALRKDGTQLPIEFSASVVSSDGDGIIQGFVRDITGRKRAKEFGEMASKILQILNEPGDFQDSVQRVLFELKKHTGFDAVGIRLENKGDFPYFVQDGFPDDFLITENTLIERNADGGMCRDEDGNVNLECTCGLVISGKFEPGNPLFTQAGSFWTNDTSPLLDIPPDEDPRLHPRNQCIHQGYSSVALVPIRNKDKNVGLIQFNDRRKGCFTLDMVELLEGIASHIGSALMRKRAEESLRESEEALRAMLSEKEVLLKEVHHRVKNNLQIISSLISLQADTLADGQLTEVFGDVRDRVRTMALVHEKLYQTEDLARLDFAEYAPDLLNYLWSAHNAASRNLCLDMSLMTLFLPVEMAVNCGLILNELVSNAIKHAFPSGDGGEVIVILEHDPTTGAVCLRVRDNGIGLPVDLDWRQSSSLGLRLVQMLAGQLRGTVQTCLDLGTEFKMSFNINGNPA